ncbi:unnamed protein product [Schistocephalus solidus]|uniref:NPH3 domain-containing protein n=1 Tax=Schistocephalus solidus TaxID=70667 RepID=A0A183TKI3_SCHSO|nr:unnamed protein product [Schistocephalus solidus]
MQTLFCLALLHPQSGRNALHELCRSKSKKSDDLVSCLHQLITRMRQIELESQQEQAQASPTCEMTKPPAPMLANGHAANGHAGSYRPLILSDWIPMRVGETALELRSSQSDTWDSEVGTVLVYFCMQMGSTYFGVFWYRKYGPGRVWHT